MHDLKFKPHLKRLFLYFIQIICHIQLIILLKYAKIYFFALLLRINENYILIFI